MMNKTLIMTLLKYLFLISLVIITSACSGKKVMIVTPQAEDDFVVVCHWGSDFLKFHGGMAVIKEKVFVVSSNEVIDCGTHWRGNGPGVYFSHPLYSDAERSVETIIKNGKAIEDVLVISPIAKHDTLKRYKTELSERHLVSAARDYLTGNYASRYLDLYSSVKPVDAEEFKRKYEGRLIEYWKELLPIIQDSFVNDELRTRTPKGFVDVYWEKAKAYE